MVGLSICSIAFTALVSPSAPFVYDVEDAVWMMPERPVAPDTLLVAPGHELSARYGATVELDAIPPHAVAYVRSVGTADLRVNDRTFPLAAQTGSCLKQTCEVDVSSALRRGSNAIEVRVTRADGIPLVRFELDVASVHLTSGEGWQVELTGYRGTTTTRSIRADDTRPYPESKTVATPLEALADNAVLIGALFFVGALGFLLVVRGSARAPTRWLPVAALACAAVFWAYLYAAKTVRIPTDVGLDARSHLHYARIVAERGELPYADECFSCYHPPLYYLTTAALLRTFGGHRGTDAERFAVKLVPILCGLGMVALSLLLARRIRDGDSGFATFAVVGAAAFPVNIYMSAYVSNEPFHAVLAGTALVAAVCVSLSERATGRSLALLSVLLALVILSKYTGLAVAAIVLAFIALKLFAIEGRSLGRVALIVSAMMLVIGLLGGWPYLRSWMRFGDPFIWNLDLPGGKSWWQPPSFHTPAYFLRFGHALVHPYYSLFDSFWDGMYSSAWGEGMPPSASLLSQRHPYWNYDLMSAGYLLALPATASIAFGFFALAREALCGLDARRCVALALVVTLAYAISFSALQLNVRFPVWGAVRATYVLCLVVPIALCTATGLSTLDRWLARRAPVALRAAFYGWLTAWVGVELLAYAA